MRLVQHVAVILVELVVSGIILATRVPWPPVPEPSKANAVVLLSGDGSRLPLALRLMQEGLAPTLVFVGTPDTLEVVNVCQQPQPFEVVCLRPHPDSTRAEARVTGQLAEARSWKSMVLVTSKYHLTRARMLFARCFEGTVQAVGEPPPYGEEFARRQVRHELLALGYATLLDRDC